MPYKATSNVWGGFNKRRALLKTISKRSELRLELRNGNRSFCGTQCARNCAIVTQNRPNHARFLSVPAIRASLVLGWVVPHSNRTTDAIGLCLGA